MNGERSLGRQTPINLAFVQGGGVWPPLKCKHPDPRHILRPCGSFRIPAILVVDEKENTD